MKTKLAAFFDLLLRALIGDSGTDRHGTLAAIWDVFGFFIMVGFVWVILAIYAVITGVW